MAPSEDMCVISGFNGSLLVWISFKVQELFNQELSWEYINRRLWEVDATLEQEDMLNAIVVFKMNLHCALLEAGASSIWRGELSQLRL